MFASLLRRAAIVFSAMLATVWATAATASADVAVGWAEHTEVSFMDFFLVLVLIPTALALLILAVCMAFLRKDPTD